MKSSILFPVFALLFLPGCSSAPSNQDVLTSNDVSKAESWSLERKKTVFEEMLLRVEKDSIRLISISRSEGYGREYQDVKTSSFQHWHIRFMVKYDPERTLRVFAGYLDVWAEEFEFAMFAYFQEDKEFTDKLFEGLRLASRNEQLRHYPDMAVRAYWSLYDNFDRSQISNIVKHLLEYVAVTGYVSDSLDNFIRHLLSQKSMNSQLEILKNSEFEHVRNLVPKT